MNKENKKEINVLDAILDPSNTDPITIVDDQNVEYTFDQVAIVPHNNEIYAILAPHEKMEGIADDEAVVMRVFEDDNGEGFLESIDDDKLIDIIFDKYYKMYDEGVKNTK